MGNGWASADQEAGFQALCERFPDHRRHLCRLFADDTRFRDICEDYRIALCAAENWAVAPRIADQFRCIAAEIEMAVEEILGPP